MSRLPGEIMVHCSIFYSFASTYDNGPEEEEERMCVDQLILFMNF